MVAVEPTMNLKMRIEQHSKPPFDSQNVLSHMSAPDLSFWSQMEGSSLFCNSAAIAAAASEMNMQNSAMPLFGAQNMMDSNHAFQSLAQLPGGFNLNSLAHHHDSAAFDHLQQQQQQQQQQQRQQQQQAADQRQGQGQGQSSQQQHQSGASNAPNTANSQNAHAFWNPPQPTHNASPASHHEASMMFGGQKLADFRTVMLPTEDKSSVSATGSPYHQMSSAMQLSNAVMCQVCVSAPSNGLHFGAKVCAACAAFFRRSVSDSKKYVCKRSQRCTLKVNDSTGYRKICRECRFKRCLDIGMLPENVQHKRHRRENDGVCMTPQHGSQHPLLSQGTTPDGAVNQLSHHSDYLDLFNHHSASLGLPQAGLNFNMPSSH